MADFLTTLLQSLVPSPGSPVGPDGAPVPSQSASMPVGPSTLPQPPDGMDADSYAGAQPSLADRLKTLLNPPDSSIAPHNVLRGLFGAAPTGSPAPPTQPPPQPDASMMEGQPTPSNQPRPPAQPINVPPGMAVGGQGSTPQPDEAIRAILAAAQGQRAPGGGQPQRQGQLQPTAQPYRPPFQRPGGAPVPGPLGPSGQSGAGGQPDMVKLLRNIFQGAAAVNPTSPKMSAFAQGGAGAMTAGYNEAERDKQQKTLQARQNFEDTLKVRKDSRDADRNDAYKARTEAYTGLSNARRDKIVADAAAASGLNTMGLTPNQYDRAMRTIQNEAKLQKDSMSPEQLQKHLSAFADRYAKGIKSGVLTPPGEPGATPGPGGPGASPASPGATPPPPAAPPLPKPGDVVPYNGKNYIFKGGNPGDKDWRKNYELVP